MDETESEALARADANERALYRMKSGKVPSRRNRNIKYIVWCLVITAIVIAIVTAIEL
jgi:hypothetical protein